MTAQAPVAAAEQRKETTIPWNDFEATLLESLDISSYDLAVLEHHLVAAKWVPSSSDEDAIKDAVFRFRQSYESDDYDYSKIFPGHERLASLFETFIDEDVAECQMEYSYRDLGPVGQFKLIVKRETAKYNAVRALIAHLAARKSFNEPTVPTDALSGISDEQAMELLKTNDRLRAMFTNSVKKSTAKETQALQQKIAEKDAEIAGMLRSLA